MLGFFYETFIQTGWILLPLFVLGLWGWWELFRFFLLIYENSRIRRFEWEDNRYSKLEQILSEFTSHYGKERPLMGVVHRFLEGLLELRRPAQLLSYEKQFFMRLQSLTQSKTLPTDHRALGFYRDTLLQAKRSFYLQVIVDFRKRLKSLKLIATVAPLLGLLGTVIGMIDTFDVISSFGNSNPLLLADGISKALLTTQAGLAVAFPLLFLYVIANRRLERLKWRLQCILSDFLNPVLS